MQGVAGGYGGGAAEEGGGCGEQRRDAVHYQQQQQQHSSTNPLSKTLWRKPSNVKQHTSNTLPNGLRL